MNSKDTYTYTYTHTKGTLGRTEHTHKHTLNTLHGAKRQGADEKDAIDSSDAALPRLDNFIRSCAQQKMCVSVSFATDCDKIGRQGSGFFTQIRHLRPVVNS